MPAPTISPLPPAPNRGNAPDLFVSRADAFVAALVPFVDETNLVAEYVTDVGDASAAALAAQVALLASGGFGGTSTTSLDIGPGTKTLTVEAGRSFLPGATVAVSVTATPTTRRMLGTVTAYNATTGALTVEVDTWTGTGTAAAWTVSLAGPRGVQGPPISWLLKTANYSPAVGEYILANTAGGPFTVTLPASPANGSEVVIQDARGNFPTAGVTVNGGAFMISNTTTDTSVLLDVSGRYSFIFVSAASAWAVTKTAKGVL